MKTISVVIGIIILIVVGFVIGKSTAKVPDTEIIYKTEKEYITKVDTVWVRQPVIEYIERDALVDTIFVAVVDTIVELGDTTEVIDDYTETIAEAEIAFDNYKAWVKYFYQRQVFEFQYEKLYDIYIEKIPILSKFKYGVNADFSFGEKRRRLNINVLFGFPHLINNLYLKLGASSDETINLGMTYIIK